MALRSNKPIEVVINMWVMSCVSLSSSANKRHHHHHHRNKLTLPPPPTPTPTPSCNLLCHCHYNYNQQCTHFFSPWLTCTRFFLGTIRGAGAVTPSGTTPASDAVSNTVSDTALSRSLPPRTRGRWYVGAAEVNRAAMWIETNEETAGR
jgi:hypothetical protein